MDCFYIITNKLKDKDYAITNEIRQYIEDHGKTCFLSEKDGEGHIIPGTVPEEAQCGLVLGGDGTLIRAVRDLGEHSLPLLGINLGTLGYLADVELKDFRGALDRLFGGQPDIEERMMLEGCVPQFEKGHCHERYCSGERGKGPDRQLQYLCKWGAAQHLSGGRGHLINSDRKHGIQSLSRGPVVEPTAQMIVITPICSHALNTSSVVLSAEDVIEVEVCEGRYGRQEQVSLCLTERNRPRSLQGRGSVSDVPPRQQS